MKQSPTFFKTFWSIDFIVIRTQSLLKSHCSHCSLDDGVWILTYLWATLPGWISWMKMPSSPRFSLFRPTTLKPRPPEVGFSSSAWVTMRPWIIHRYMQMGYKGKYTWKCLTKVLDHNVLQELERRNAILLKDIHLFGVLMMVVKSTV